MPRYLGGGGMSIGRGLTFAGQQLAQGLMRRDRNRRMTQQAEQMFPEQELPFQGMPEEQKEGMESAAKLAHALSGVPAVGPMANVMKTAQQGSKMAMAPTIAQKIGESQNAKSEQMRSLMTSGDPRLEGIAMQEVAKRYQSDTVQPVTGGFITKTPQGKVTFHSTAVTKNILDDPTKRYKVNSIGGTDYLMDYGNINPETGMPEILKSAEDAASGQDIWVDAGKKNSEGAPLAVGMYFDPKTKQLEKLKGEDGKDVFQIAKNVELTGGIADVSKNVYGRRQLLDRELMQKSERRLTSILEGYDDFYRTIWGQGWKEISSVRAKLGILGEGQSKEFLKGIVTFEQDTNTHMNLYIKEITGAQMSEAEAKRLMRAISNLTDDPVTFKAKLDNSLKKLQVEQAAKEKLISELMADEKDLSYKEAKEEAERAFTDVGTDILAMWETPSDVLSEGIQRNK